MTLECSVTHNAFVRMHDWFVTNASSPGSAAVEFLGLVAGSERVDDARVPVAARCSLNFRLLVPSYEA